MNHSRSLGKNSPATGKNSGRFKSTVKNYPAIGRKLRGNFSLLPSKFITGGHYRRAQFDGNSGRSRGRVAVAHYLKLPSLVSIILFRYFVGLKD